ncbi:hypothetical protein KORDIASMS9_01566 [Kordia sp. SMS9]|nr:hypothetical protein KORDIASMS9_01566 [Kordia sp. SMS9]
MVLMRSDTLVLSMEKFLRIHLHFDKLSAGKKQTTSTQKNRGEAFQHQKSITSSAVEMQTPKK